MISDEEIMQAAIEADIAWDDNGVIRTPYREDADIQPALTRFARAIYNLAQQHQRESDAALCRDAAEKYMERSKNSNTHTRASISLACNAAATCLETAIRDNKDN